MTTGEPQRAPSRKRRRFRCSRRTLLAIGAAAILTIGIWFFVTVQEMRKVSIACGAQSHLNQLQLTLIRYHDAHGRFPPAYLVDNRGVPIHSWRVLILPFIGEKELHDAYRFDEPWNGPNNRKLADRMPEFFRMPNEPASTTMTDIVAIVGPGTAFPGSESTQMEDFTDGLDNTILLVEIAGSDIGWLEPRDLRVEEMSFKVNDPGKPAISSSRRRGPYVVFADSIHTHQLSSSLRPEMLKALTTIAGREKMYIGEVSGVGLVSPGPGPATDEKIRQLSLDEIYSLWLSRSDITDAVLPRLATAPSLTKLHLRGTGITDDGLRQIRQGSSLPFLDLCCTEISDNGLQHMAKLKGLQYPGISIDLKGTRVTMSGAAQFLKSLPQPEFPLEARLYVNEGSLTHKFMRLGGSPLTDAQIECFRGLTGFYQVDVSKTRVTDAGMKVVAGFVHLVHLNVSGTRITDTGLEHLKGLAQLRSLDLRNTCVTDEGVKSFQQVLPECGISR